MKCHYEVLGVTIDADDNDIKKSYRKLALRLHPDKNPDNIEECTKQFHLVQQAYEVLIDPQERAWYDKHREAILRGGLGHGDGYEDDGLDVYQYFNTVCYTGFADDEQGFYAVYKRVFEELSTQDYEFMPDRDIEWHMPSFGDSNSSYEEVVGPFYAFWESFCTAKSYVWVEKYDTREAPNRQVRRLMEQDNKKAREKSRKERNEEIRALVAFVRKRDKRVQAQKKRLEERAVEISRLGEERKEAEKRKRRKNMEGYQESGWSAMSELAGDLEHLEAQLARQFGEEQSTDEAEGEEEEEEEEDTTDDLFCVACGKLFKTDKAMTNHERSKKHKENVALLRAQMEEEEEEEEIESGGEEGDRTVEADISPSDEDELDSEGSSTEDVRPKAKLSKKQKKKKRRQKQKLAEQSEVVTEDMSHLSVNDVTENTLHDVTENTLHDAKESPSVEEEQQRCSLASEDQCDSTSEKLTVETDPQSESNLQSHEEKATARSSKLSSESVENKETKKSRKAANANEQTPGISANCNTCGQKFKSRSKLFEHLKSTGHALRLDKGAGQTTNLVDDGNKRRKNKKGKR